MPASYECIAWSKYERQQDGSYLKKTLETYITEDEWVCLGFIHKHLNRGHTVEIIPHTVRAFDVEPRADLQTESHSKADSERKKK